MSQFYRIKPDSLASFLASWQYGNNLQYWNSDDLLNNTDLVSYGRFDLNPQKNTRENMQIPLKDIKAVTGRGRVSGGDAAGGRCSYTMPRPLFTLSDIGVSMHSYLNELDVFTQSLAKAVHWVWKSVCSTAKVSFWAKQKPTAAVMQNWIAGRIPRCYWRLTAARPIMIDLKNPALDTAGLISPVRRGYTKQFFVLVRVITCTVRKLW